MALMLLILYCSEYHGNSVQALSISLAGVLLQKTKIKAQSATLTPTENHGLIHKCVLSDRKLFSHSIIFPCFYQIQKNTFEAQFCSITNLLHKKAQECIVSWDSLQNTCISPVTQDIRKYATLEKLILITGFLSFQFNISSVNSSF